MNQLDRSGLFKQDLSELAEKFHSGQANEHADHSDTQRLRSSFDGTIERCDVDTGNQLFTLKGHGSDGNHVAWSPDFKSLASGSWDKGLILWGIP